METIRIDIDENGKVKGFSYTDPRDLARVEQKKDHPGWGVLRSVAPFLVTGGFGYLGDIETRKMFETVTKNAGPRYTNSGNTVGGDNRYSSTHVETDIEAKEGSWGQNTIYIQDNTDESDPDHSTNGSYNPTFEGDYNYNEPEPAEGMPVEGYVLE